MRHICSHCRQTSPSGNLWCQDVDCPAGSLPKLFNYGDYLGNIKILEIRRVLRTSIIYKAERERNKESESLLLKVANPGEENVRYLKEEANVLRSLTPRKPKARQGLFPRWKHHGAVNSQDAFGIATFREQTRHFYLTEYVDGDFLSDFLLDNPQPWHEHVGWFMIGLADAVGTIQRVTGALHLNLNPDVILVKRNYAGIPQPILLDLGLLQPVESTVPASESEKLRQHLQAAYTPRELVSGGRQLTSSVDVYELGLILFEMLAGRSAYPYALRRTEDVYNDIEGTHPVVPRRLDLPVSPRKNASQTSAGEIDTLLGIVERSVRTDHPKRYENVAKFASALGAIYGKVPEGKEPFSFSRFFRNAGQLIAIAAAVVFVLFVLISLFTALVQAPAV